MIRLLHCGLFFVFIILLVITLNGCASEQLSAVQGEFAPLWHDNPVMPTTLPVPPK